MPVNSTIPLSRVVAMAQLYVRQAPLTINTWNDPALTIADWVRGTMLSPPFAWRWNRGTLQINCVAGTQDYQVNVPVANNGSSGFGYLETATVTDGSGQASALEISLNLDEDSTPKENLPTHIAARLDDGNQNITFRLLPIPDQPYLVNLSYQFSSQPFQSLNQTWAPLPDYLSYIYTQGFLAKTYEYMSDDRFPTAMNLFLRELVMVNMGLDASQIDVFMNDFLTSQIYKEGRMMPFAMRGKPE